MMIPSLKSYAMMSCQCHVSLMPISSQAVQILHKKGTAEVVCTRSSLAGEEPVQKVGSRKVAKSALIVGGAALANKHPKGKVKVESGGTAEGASAAVVPTGDEEAAAWQWLFKSAPNKCCSHLLR